MTKKHSKNSTLEAVRGVKSHLGDLLSQVRQGQQWKKKYTALNLEFMKLKKKEYTTLKFEFMKHESEKMKKRKCGVQEVKHQFHEISDDKMMQCLKELFIIFDASPQVCKAAMVMAHELKYCFQLMSKRPKTVSTCIMYICMKPHVDKKIISEKAQLSAPSINLTTKIIQNFLMAKSPP
tara:strand:- start:1943 stop:2479 length:537 start_codon:yes stop_codon:yes gene_type:complete